MMSFVFFGATLLALTPLISLLFYLISRGWSRFDLLAFTQLPPAPNASGGGFANALWGTIGMVTLASSLSIPIGVLGAVYGTEFGQKWAKSVVLAANVLYSVPSILIGVFVYGLIVLPTTTVTQGRYSFSAVAGGVALGIVMLPLVFRTTVESLKQIEGEIRWGALAVGATASQVVLGVVIPAALPSIGTGILLGIARIAGETAPLIFTALFNQYWARNLWDRTASLAVLIYEFSRSPFSNQQQLAWTTALILCLLVTIGVILAKVCSRWQLR
ncbi:MAG: phosphate ABC transporter permease PstA [Cyanobacteria bacterium KgW148]|nr:phosphate ABC transporter permease PstA [Cyanobacteria bacterium KgW148]